MPQTGNAEYLKEFPVLGGSGDTVPEVRPRCDPGLGVMDVPGRKWAARRRRAVGPSIRRLETGSEPVFFEVLRAKTATEGADPCDS